MRGFPIAGEHATLGARAPSPLAGEGGVAQRRRTRGDAAGRAWLSRTLAVYRALRRVAAPERLTARPLIPSTLPRGAFPRRGWEGARAQSSAPSFCYSLSPPWPSCSASSRSICAPTSWRCGSPIPGVVKSVTWLSQDPRAANLAAQAAALPANDGHAEEALAYRPDAVLVGPFADPASIALLQRLGAPVVEVGAPQTLDGVRRQIRDLAAALGEPQRGEALVAAMDARLARVVVDPSRPRLKAVVLRPNGFTVGPGSLVDEILTRAGLDNLARAARHRRRRAGSARGRGAARRICPHPRSR